ncbi:heparinase II/III family protein [Pseudomonas corrugata]|uniref:heparinase II/III family protein n=1 Tax=Pseudomonas corrugata TaxID=47879 RepID=UPI002234509F|nr:heparinase II/III-family protein [Pseudomonas corrugata]UZE07941.1 heparinase II/III-family protein [Pseudomonas corrugata]
MKFITVVSAYFSLGLTNVIKVAFYRLRLRLGFSRIRQLKAEVQSPPYYRAITIVNTSVEASDVWTQEASDFGRWKYSPGNDIPQWQCNPITGVCIPNSELEWWQIPDFDSIVGDIKFIWEASRFDWVLSFAKKAKAGDGDSLVRLNTWLADWCEKNAPFKGANWKCGQEASIRVMHLSMAAIILDQVVEPCKGLLDLIEVHLKRIEPTIGYAMAQNNNHGTSEAAALFIGGSWLLRTGRSAAKRWERLGRYWLSNRAKHLVESDGSFSQYSVNYHRVMLDTFCMVEIWRRRLDLPRLPPVWHERSEAATVWLYSLVNARTGDAPNIGANDGARLLPLANSDYRDYRPTVQLSMKLFGEKRAYAHFGVWDDPFKWLGLERANQLAKPPTSRVFDNGGYAVLHLGNIMVVLRYPRFRFRPSHADILHLDLWENGINLLRDAGTYSYSTAQEWMSYFPGTISHNTVQFDNRDQMPKVSRFLFGKWLKTSDVEPIVENHNGMSFSASYKDHRGASHKRSVLLNSEVLRVTDLIMGFQKAVMRWRLPLGNWVMKGRVVSNGEHSIVISADTPILRMELVEGWESRYYASMQQVIVLEVEVHQAGTLTTEYFFKS